VWHVWLMLLSNEIVGLYVVQPASQLQSGVGEELKRV